MGLCCGTYVLWSAINFCKVENNPLELFQGFEMPVREIVPSFFGGEDEAKRSCGLFMCRKRVEAIIFRERERGHYLSTTLSLHLKHGPLVK